MFGKTLLRDFFGNTRLKLLDYVVILFAIGVILFFSIRVYGMADNTLYVHIKSESKEWIIPLNTDRMVEVSGPIGITRVWINNGSVRIVDSPCKNKICVRSGAIYRVGQWVACLPNRVMVSVEGKKGLDRENTVDAINF